MSIPIQEVLDPTTADLISLPDKQEDVTKACDEPPLADEHFTDVGASRRFAQEHCGVLRYCDGIGWLSWDNCRWTSVGAKGRAVELAKQSARRWLEEAMQIADVDSRARAVRAALTLEGGSHIYNAVSLAESDPLLVVKAAELDRDPWCFNLVNGTVDLRSGKLRPHSPADMITRLAPVTFVPNARHDILDRYLRMIDAHTPGMSSFLARVFGVSLTGDAETESLFLIQGEGGSGKTTLIEAVAAMLGDYSAKLNFESFCQSRHGRSPGGASPDLVVLRGARLAYASEGESSARLDAGKIKALTGNEPITARALYCAPMTFPQTWKLHLVSNFEPKTDSDDTGIWRRMLKLPFAVIPPEQRDPAVKRTLVYDTSARSALFQWALIGCLDWQTRGGGRKGLALPAEVEVATEAYRKKQDTLSEWWEDLLAEGATLTPTGFTSKKDLHHHYKDWCESNGYFPYGNQRLNAYLEGKGLVSERNACARIWRGLTMPPFDF